MRKYIVGFILAAILSFSGMASAMTAAQWHGLSQSQRNSLITSAADLYPKNVIGSSDPNSLYCNCYLFAKTIVGLASSSTMTIPPMSGGWYWDNNQYVTSYPWNYPYSLFNITKVQPGNIIQMTVYFPSTGYYGPHTATVYRVYSDSLDFIESHVGGCKVQVRHVLFSSFGPGGTIYPYTINIIK